MKSKIVFYLLVVYIFTAFGWWTFLLYRQSEELYSAHKELIHYRSLSKTNNDFEVHNKLVDSEKLETTLSKRKWMIISEALVFFILLAFGMYQIKKSFNSEMEMNTIQKNFLLSITHELKSPLASIKLYLQTILKRQLSKDVFEQYLNNSIEDIDRLNELAEKMLLASRIESKSYNFIKQDFDFSETARKIAEKINSAHYKTLKIDSTIEPSIIYHGDESALSSVILNLLENSIKYGNSSPVIQLKLSKKDDIIRLIISDNGTGIPHHEKEKIFHKFYRVGSEDTRTSKGTGLGLYIVKKVLDNHSAQITVTDNKPQGTVFEIIFKLKI